MLTKSQVKNIFQDEEKNKKDWEIAIEFETMNSLMMLENMVCLCFRVKRLTIMDSGRRKKVVTKIENIDNAEDCRE